LNRYTFGNDPDELKKQIDDLEQAIGSLTECKNALQNADGSPTVLTADEMSRINKQHARANRTLRRITGSSSIGGAWEMLIAAYEHQKKLEAPQDTLAPPPQVGTRSSVRAVSGGLPGLGRRR
jgi:phage shock protein A